MLCVLLLTYTGAVTAEDITSPSNNYNITDAVTIKDPWSPVIGDTEGAPVPTEETAGLPNGVNARRAADGLLQNIRKQLMRNNYDYVLDYSERPSDILSREQLLLMNTWKYKANSAVRTSSARGNLVRRTYQIIAKDSPYGAARRRVKTTPKLTVIPMQMASVSMQLKGNQKKFFRSIDSDFALNPLDYITHSPATTTKGIKSEIVVSQKDLLFYIDDSRLRRKNSQANIVPHFSGRRAYNKSNLSNLTIRTSSLKRNKANSAINNTAHIEQNKHGVKNLTDVERRDRRTLKTGDYAFNEIKQIINPLKNKTNLMSSKAAQQEKNKNKSRNYKDIEQRKKLPHNCHNSSNSLHNDLCDEEEDIHEDKKKQVKSIISSIDNSHQTIRMSDKLTTLKTNDFQYSQTASSNPQNFIQKQLVAHKKNKKKDQGINKQPLQDKQFKNFMVGSRRRYKGKSKSNRRFGHSLETDLFNNINIQKYKKSELKGKSNKYKRKHNDEIMHSEVKNDKTYTTYKSQKTNGQFNYSHDAKSNEHMAQHSEKGEMPIIDADFCNNLRRQDTSKMYNKQADKRRYLRYCKQLEQKEDINGKKNNTNVGILNDQNYEPIINIQDKKADDEFKSLRNDSQPNRGRTSKDISNSDKEDVDKFNDRQTKRYRDKKLVQIVNNSRTELNYTQDEQINTSPKAKFKLLKVPSSGGSRRSYRAERRFIEERGSTGVALIALDKGPFPQFRLPRSRRQYMYDRSDQRPPLIEQMSRKSLNKRLSVRRRSRKNQH